MKNILKRFLEKRKRTSTNLELAEKQGLITKEEHYRLKYERAKEDYMAFLKTTKKKGKK